MDDPLAQDPVTKPDKTDVVMTVEDLAVYMKLSKRSIYNMVAAGQIPAVKVASQWRFYRPAIDRWLEEQSWKSVAASDNESTNKE